jgi:hypothetical protein
MTSLSFYVFGLCFVCAGILIGLGIPYFRRERVKHPHIPCKVVEVGIVKNPEWTEIPTKSKSKLAAPIYFTPWKGRAEYLFTNTQLRDAKKRGDSQAKLS